MRVYLDTRSACVILLMLSTNIHFPTIVKGENVLNNFLRQERHHYFAVGKVELFLRTQVAFSFSVGSQFLSWH